MTAAEPLPIGAEADWSTAERVASEHRDRRLNPDPRHRHRNRVLPPIAAFCWVAAVVFAISGLLIPGDPGDDLEFISFGGLVAYAVVGGWWLTSTGRYLIRGSATSIRTAIPYPDRKSIRRQLALREPLDPDHQDVVLELAHQGRELLIGQVALYASYVPLYLNIAHNSHDWVIPIVLATGGTALLIGTIMLIVTNRRLGQLIQHHQPTEPSPGTSPTNA